MRPKVWLALNGLEFTPPGADTPVCWPWTQIKVVPKQGFVPLDAAGEPAKDARGRRMTVGCVASLRDLGRMLKARALREPMQLGESKRFNCRSKDEYVAGIFMMVVSLLFVSTVAFSAHQRAELVLMCSVGGLGVLASLLLMYSAWRRNVTELVISGTGVGALLTSGLEVHVPWRDVNAQESRVGSIQSVNGLTLRYKSNYDIQAAIRAARRKTGGFAAARAALKKAVARLVFIAALTGVLCGAAGALALHLMGLPQGTTPTPLWLFSRMAGFPVIMSGVLPLMAWLQFRMEHALMPAGVKLYSSAPPPHKTLPSPAS
jgi:hypothetical protein